MSSAQDLKRAALGPPRLRIAVAESLTSGRLQALVGSVSGASEYFLGGITAYTLEEKVRHLGVDRESAAAVDCVSAAVAEQMACGVGELFGADAAAATTGYAEEAPSGGPAFAWWALARRAPGGWSILSKRSEFPGRSRTEVQELLAEEVCAALALWLREPAAGRTP